MYSLDDTIAAVASPPGGAARSIVRLSGPRAMDCLTAVFQADAEAAFPPPVFPAVVAGRLRLPGLDAALPCEAFLWQAPRSYTRQTMVEIHSLGSSLLGQLAARAFFAAGARPAEPGEFTLRAFLGGRIDLGQAEAVLGVIDAAGPAQLQVALEQLAGGLAEPLRRLRESLADLLADLEAALDFAYENIEIVSPEDLRRRLDDARGRLGAVRRRLDGRSRTVESVKVVISGRPNAGKSSLFNALSGKRLALVADNPGVTRDYLETELDLDGLKCRLIDTAGVESERGEGREERGEGGKDQVDCVEAAADEIAARQRAAADVLIYCGDSTSGPDDFEQRMLAGQSDPRRIVVLTKCDLAKALPPCLFPARRERGVVVEQTLRTSSHSGEGIEDLRRLLRAACLAARSAGAESVAGTADRCRQSLRAAARSLRRAAASCGQMELAAEEIRVALHELGKVGGAVHADDLLERVFSRFCIGK